MAFSKQEYQSGLPFPSAGDLPDPGIEPVAISYVSCIAGRFLTYWAIYLFCEFTGQFFCWSARITCCCCSVTKSCPTLCNPMDCSMPGPPFPHHLLELAQVYVHWCHPTISSSVILFSFCLQSCLASESFPVSQLFALGGQSTGASASASVLPMNIQDPLGLTVWSPCCPRDSQESSPAPQFKCINSLALSFLYGPTLTSIHDYWKDYSLDYMDLCQQSDFFAF